MFSVPLGIPKHQRVETTVASRQVLHCVSLKYERNHCWKLSAKNCCGEHLRKTQCNTAVGNTLVSTLWCFESLGKHWTIELDLTLVLTPCVRLNGAKGRDTLGDKSQRQFSVTSRSVCTTCKTSRCDRTPVACTRSDLVWAEMWTCFLIPYGGSYDVLSLVHLYFVAATCCRKRTHGATTLLSLILSLRSVARIQTGLKILPQRQWFSQN